MASDCIAHPGSIATPPNNFISRGSSRPHPADKRSGKVAACTCFESHLVRVCWMCCVRAQITLSTNTLLLRPGKTTSPLYPERIFNPLWMTLYCTLKNTAPMSDTAELESKLKYFEERADVSDPEQKRMLDEMREHLSRLKQLRGDWNKPSTFRLWNDPAPTGKVEAPLAIDSFRSALTGPCPFLALGGVFALMCIVYMQWVVHNAITQWP